MHNGQRFVIEYRSTFRGLASIEQAARAADVDLTDFVHAVIVQDDARALLNGDKLRPAFAGLGRLVETSPGDFLVRWFYAEHAGTCWAVGVGY